MPTTTTRAPAPRGVIDHTAYPDIIAQIIEETDHAGLLRLRATSSYFQDEADLLLFRHLILDDADRPAALLKAATVDYDALMRPTTRLVIWSPHGRLPLAPWGDARDVQRMRAADLLGKARVVDYHCDYDVGADPLLAAALGQATIARRVFPSRTVIPASMVIDYIDVSIRGYWTAPPLGGNGGSLACPTTPDVPDQVGTSILVVLYPNRIGDWSGHFRLGKRGPNTRCALHFVPRDTSPSRSDNASMFELFINTARMNGPLAYGVIGPIFAQLHHPLRTHQTMFAGITEIPPRLLGLPESIAGSVYRQAILGATVCIGMTYEIGRGWHFPPPEQIRDNVRRFGTNAMVASTDDYLKDFVWKPAAAKYITVPIVHGGDVARIFAPAATPGNAPPVETPNELVEQLYTVFTHEALRRFLDRG